MDGLAFVKEAHSFIGITGGNDLVAERLKNLASDIANERFVLNQEDSRACVGIDDRHGSAPSLGSSRKICTKSKSFPGLRILLKSSAGIGEDLTCDESCVGERKRCHGRRTERGILLLS